MDSVGTLSTVNLGVPLYMVVAFVAIISISLLFSRIQLGLLYHFFLPFILDTFAIKHYY